MSFATASFVGVGQTIAYNSTTLNHITDIDYSGSKVDTADTTDTSAISGYRTFIPALKDAGDCQIKGIWYPGEASQEGLEPLKGTVASWVHTLPNNLGIVSFTGMLTSVDKTANLDKSGEFTTKIKISGPIIYAQS